jgi:glycosyltransferase involved in cell wall biosynthesis
VTLGLAGRLLFVPSAGLARRRRVRLLALLAVRDEMRFLPGFLGNVAPQVDGIVALDDGSRDGTGDYLAEHPAVLEVLRIAQDRPTWDEPGNHRALVAAGLRHGADWLIALDADERVERQFRPRAERVIRRGRLLGFSAYAVRLRELWGSRHTYRSDGRWPRKRPPRLFQARADHQFDPRPLHGAKAPLQARVLGTFPVADLEVYHLRMIRRDDREARRDRYLALDPDERWQPRLGYAYLTDERGLRLRRVRPARDFEE